LDFLKRLAYDSLVLDYLDESSAEQLNASVVFTAKTIVEKAKEFVRDAGLTSDVSYQLVSDVIATPLLREVGAETYVFAHLTIHEYLAAESLCAQPDYVKRFCQIYFHEKLSESEILPMTLGIVGQTSELSALLQDLPESINLINFRIRARALGYMAQVDQQTAIALNDRLIEFLADFDRAEDVPYRYSVLQSFCASGIESASLISALTALCLKNKNVPEFAVNMLGQLSGPTAIEDLTTALKGRDIPSGWRAAELLGQMGDERAVPFLIEALNSKEIGVQEAAIDALGQIGGDEAVWGLSRAINGEADAFSMRAISALGKAGGRPAYEALVKLLESDDLVLRLSAIDALAELEEQQGFPVLVRLLQSAEPVVRSRALVALARFRESFVPLTEALHSHDKGVRRTAVIGLERFGRKSVSFLIRALKDEEEDDVRAVVVKTLANIGDERAVAPLLESAGDSNWEIRLAVANALGKIGGAAAVRGLTAMLKDKSRIVSHKALRMLGRVGGEEAISALIEALKSPDGEFSAVAILELGNLKVESAIDGLIETLNHESGYIRGCAAESLGLVGKESVVHLLAQALKDDDVFVRGRAAIGLGSIGGEQALQALLSATGDSCMHVRLRVTHSLGLIGRNQAVEELVKLLDDEEFEVRVAAADALGKIGGEYALSSLFSWWFKVDLDPFKEGNLRVVVGRIWAKAERNPKNLVKVLGDHDVNKSALAALVRLNAVEAVIPLLEKLESGPPESVSHAARQLSMIEGKSIAAGLLKGLSYPNEFVRLKATQFIPYYENRGELLDMLSTLIMFESNMEVRTSAMEAIQKYRLKLSGLGEEETWMSQKMLQR
jgi:HEAT repeat protein